MMRISPVKHCHPGSAYLEPESVGAQESSPWQQGNTNREEAYKGRYLKQRKEECPN